MARGSGNGDGKGRARKGLGRQRPYGGWKKKETLHTSLTREVTVIIPVPPVSPEISINSSVWVSFFFFSFLFASPIPRESPRHIFEDGF